MEKTPKAVRATIKDIIELTKPSLTLLVIFTALVGLLLAPREIGLFNGSIALIGITTLVAGSCALNCYLEREVDKKMRRTEARSLPSGRLSPSRALKFSATLILSSLCLLWLKVNLLTALLGLLASVLYLYAYTPLKQKSSSSLFVGAVPGALPRFWDGPRPWAPLPPALHPLWNHLRLADPPFYCDKSLPRGRLP